MHLILSRDYRELWDLRLPVVGGRQYILRFDRLTHRLGSNKIWDVKQHDASVPASGAASAISWRACTDDDIAGGTPTRVTVHVRRQEIRVLKEGELVFHVTGDFSQLPPPTGEAAAQARTILLTCSGPDDAWFNVHQAALDRAPPPLEHMLEFTGQSYIHIPGFKYDGSHPLTFEARLADWLPQGGRYASFLDANNGSENQLNRTQIGFNSFDVDRAQRNLEIHVNSGAVAPRLVFKSAAPPRREEMMDLAVVFDEGKANVFINGKKTTESSWMFQSDVPRTGEGLAVIGAAIGSDRNKVKFGYIGFIHGVRISNTARYTGNYVVPKTLEPDADTYLLYKMNEGKGNVLTDLSGNKLHGEIVGAKWVPATSTPKPTPSTKDKSP